MRHVLITATAALVLAGCSDRQSKEDYPASSTKSVGSPAYPSAEDDGSANAAAMEAPAPTMRPRQRVTPGEWNRPKDKTGPKRP